MTTRHDHYRVGWCLSHWCWVYVITIPLPTATRRLHALAARRVAAWQARLAAAQARRAHRRLRRLSPAKRGQAGVA